MNEIETILCSLKACDRSRLLLDRRATLLSPREERRFERILKDRIGGAPLAAVLGHAEFYGLSFKVNADVLVPRPETEVLVEHVLQGLASSGLQRCRILDAGTGSGNIAVTMAQLSPVKETQVVALDISPRALEVARTNARRHGVLRRLSFVCGDMARLADLGTFDLIVSNPPYVRPEEERDLPEDVLREPREALFAGERGLACYRALERGARLALRPGGAIFLEMGEDQAGDLRGIFGDRALWTGLAVKKDLAGRDRVFTARKVIHG